MEFSTKYWIIVVVLALVLLIGSGALSVWICKLYDTEKAPSLAPGVSPFPDVVPFVTPPATDPTVNTCYKWCDGKVCPDVKPVTCQTDADCLNKCTPPNSVTGPAKCDNKPNGTYTCIPPYQNCISNFPTYPGTDNQGNPTELVDPSNLKSCLTDTDCNLCQDTPEGETMNCVFVQDDSNLTLCDGACFVQGIPQGYYCLPERTGCNAKAGTATWSSEGWECKCLWDSVMSGPECNTLVACRNNELTDGTKSLQQLLVNCNDSSHPLCGLPWVPESGIDPTGCYDTTKGFGNPIQCGVTNAAPNCVCQCDGLQKNTYKGFTYDQNQPLTCVLDPCNNGAWGRSLLGDAAYQLNAMSQVVYTLQVVSPNQGELTLLANSPLTITEPSPTKFEMMAQTDKSFDGNLQSYSLVYDSSTLSSNWQPINLLTTNEDGSKIGTPDYVFGSGAVNKDGQKWVLQPIPDYPQRQDNLDNLTLSNPTWNRPAGAQFTSPLYNVDRFLLYNTSTNTFSLGPMQNNAANVSLVVLQRVKGANVANDAGHYDYITQPFTNCACSGANSVTSATACYDSNDNYVGFKNLLPLSVQQSDQCTAYSRNISLLCDPYTIPGSVVTIQPPEASKKWCDDYATDLKTLLAQKGLDSTLYPSSTNLFSKNTGFVPGLDKFTDINGIETLKSVCTADPCTGKYGDPSYAQQNQSGFWDATVGQCACQNNQEDTTTNYYPFAVDTLNSKWNNTCKTDPTNGVCVCNHISNPLCAVCQNACQGGNTFCKSDPDFPCPTSNVSCDTDDVTGGPKCVCKNDCILVPYSTNTCMARIPTNANCAGHESEDVCLNQGDVCTKVEKMVDDANVAYILKYGTPFVCIPTGDKISYCAGQQTVQTPQCWDKTNPKNNVKSNACDDSSDYQVCPF